LGEQLRNALYSLLWETGLIAQAPPVIPDLQPEEPQIQEVFSAPQKALGLTDIDIETGGSIKQRLEDQTRTVEANSCKLCQLIASVDFLQREARKNMNVIMQELENIKKEQLVLKGIMLAHDVNVLKIVDSNGVSEAKFIQAAQELGEKVQKVLPPMAATEFVPYDEKETIHHCIHNWPHKCKQPRGDDVEEDGDGAEAGATDED
jgi:hypothetical protein